MTLRAIAIVSVGTLFTAPALAAESFIDDFENGRNDAAWTFGAPVEAIVPDGGNPGAWLSAEQLFTFAPILRSAWGTETPFAGDYRAAGVTHVALDARTDFAAFGAGGREMSILLRDTNGTPDNVDDDDYAYFVGPLVPQVGEGWKHYVYEIPSQSTDAVPPGWSGGWVGDAENFRPGVDWNDVIQSVDRVEIWWLHPAFFAIIQEWEVGVDNVEIVMEPAGCDGDVDESGDVGFDDLLMVLSAWGTCEGCPEDVDGSGTVDFDDLLIVLSNWGPCD